jgi:hypothetical protein
MSTEQLYINPPPAVLAIRDRADDLWTFGACIPVAAGAGLVLLAKIAVRSLLHPDALAPEVRPALSAAQ